MREYVKVFFALAAIIGGVVCVLCYVIMLAAAFGWASNYVSLAFVGVLLIAGGATYFWMRRLPDGR